MPTINVIITSTMGFVKSTNAIVSPNVLVGSLLNFQGQSTSTIGEPQTKVLSIESETSGYPIPVFNCYPGQDSDSQKILFKNSGTTSLVVTSVLFSSEGATPKIEYGPGWGAVGTTISPGTNKYFNLRYNGGGSFGNFINFITVNSDNDQGSIKIPTRQNISYGFNWVSTPSNYNETITEIGKSIETTFLINPDSRSTANGDIITQLSATSTHSGGWKILDTGILNGVGHVKVRFDADYVANTNIYSQSLVVTVNGITKNITNYATVIVSTGSYRHFIDWLSPISTHNSVVGISYDLVDAKRILTIGVGMGGDGTPQYDQGGSLLLDMKNLGIGAASQDPPFAHWAEVYQFYNLGTGTARTMVSGLKNLDGEYYYKVKTSDYYNYGDYFGNGTARGSMFTVYDDGTGNLSISLNGIREYSTDANFNMTLDNLSRSFHYYSQTDTGTRFNNLPQYPIDSSPSTGTVKTPITETRTRIFRGFSGIGNTWTTVTSIVSIPN